jgi:hypothetical protein
VRFEYAYEIKSNHISSHQDAGYTARTEPRRKSCAALILLHPAPPRRLPFKNRKGKQVFTSMRRGEIFPQAGSREKLFFQAKARNETGEASVTSCPTSPSFPTSHLRFIDFAKCKISEGRGKRREAKRREGIRYGTVRRSPPSSPTRAGTDTQEHEA